MSNDANGVIDIRDLHKSFGKLEVLAGISLRFPPAQITAVLGPNSSGKTTLIKCILGMVLPDRGGITLEGSDIGGKWQYRRKIDYLPQIARFPENLSARELIRMVEDLRRQKAQPEPLIERFGLEPFLHKKLHNLSGGTRQKINVMLAFMFDCPILILDEPTTGLDPLAMTRLKELIRQSKEDGKTILITTHIMDFVEEVADNVVFLLEGKIHFQGTLGQLNELYREKKLERTIARILAGSASGEAQSE